jgi:hypothetical protein
MVIVKSRLPQSTAVILTFESSIRPFSKGRRRFLCLCQFQVVQIPFANREREEVRNVFIRGYTLQLEKNILSVELMKNYCKRVFSNLIGNIIYFRMKLPPTIVCEVEKNLWLDSILCKIGFLKKSIDSASSAE